MGKNTLSSNLGRIKDATDEIRTTLNMPNASVEELASTVVIPPSGTIDINSNGVTDVALYEYANVNLDCNPREKDVNFWDYDGTLLYSYTFEEINKMDGLPAFPTHPGLVCQGWNWTLEEIKCMDVVTDVGLNYITDDGATRLYISIIEDHLHLGVTINQSKTNGVVLNWGDGSPTETKDGVGDVTFSHDYPQVGDYIITLLPDDDCSLLLKANYAQGAAVVHCGDFYLSGYLNQIYASFIKKIEFGKNNRIQGAMFIYMRDLQTISLPIDLGGATFGTANGYLFYINNSILKCLVIPHSITTIAPGALYRFGGLKCILPGSLTTFGETGFQAASCLHEVTIPYQVSSLPGNYSSNCPSLIWRIPKAVLKKNYNGSVFANYRAIQPWHIEEGVTQLGSSCFSGACFSAIYCPSTLTTFNNGVFSGCNYLEKIVCYGDIQRIRYNAISGNQLLKFVDFSHNVSIPVLDSNGIQYLNDFCKFIVPDDLYEDWIVANRWSDYADRIVKASEWEGGNS